MGSEIIRYKITCKESEIQERIISDIKEEIIESGSGAYSGNIGQKYQPKKVDRQFPTLNDFYDYMEDENIANKWDDYVWYAEIKTNSLVKTYGVYAECAS